MRLTSHARHRMLERDISYTQVRAVLESGTPEKTHNGLLRYRCFDHFVIYDPQKKLVVTVYTLRPWSRKRWRKQQS